MQAGRKNEKTIDSCTKRIKVKQYLVKANSCCRREARRDARGKERLGCSVAYSIYSIGGRYTCYIVYYTIVLHSVLDANFGFEQIVISIWARPERGLAASSSTSNRVNSKWFKYQKKVELCYKVL